MNRTRFPQVIREIYRLVAELEDMFPGRPFTPDGHMVGSIGECHAAYCYGVQLLPPSSEGRDASKDGRSIEIKATQGDCISLRSEPEHLLVLRISKDGSFEEIYNGPGNLVWALVAQKSRPSNGQYQVRISSLRNLMKNVAQDQRLPRVRE
jgi:hypothetical protein